MILCISYHASAETSLEGRDLVRLEGRAATVVVDLGGGGIVDFHLNGSDLNPFVWNYPEKGDLAPRRMGHFVCFDRLGRPSETEVEHGMPFHGEAAHVAWRVLSGPEVADGMITVVMSCDLPLAGMRLTRAMRLSETSPVLSVTETVENTGALGRMYNIVQHPSLGGTFLDDSLRIDSNAAKGFYLGVPVPDIGEPVIYWPHFVYGGRLVDIRRVEEEQDPGVVNFVFGDGEQTGWVTACNPGGRLMLGYIWKTDDYPWLRIWRSNLDGAPLARGLEFGTTPLPLPFGQILEKGPMLGRPVLEYIDADGKVSRSYVAFLAEIPPGYGGVAEIVTTGGDIVLRERGETGREITLNR